MRRKFFVMVTLFIFSLAYCFSSSVSAASAATHSNLVGQWTFEKTVSVEGGGDVEKFDRDFQREFGWKDNVALVFTDANSGAMRVRTGHKSVNEKGLWIAEDMMPFNYIISDNKISITFIVDGKPGDTFNCLYEVKGNLLQINGFPFNKVQTLFKK